MRLLTGRGWVVLSVLTLMISTGKQSVAGPIVFSQPNDPTQFVVFSHANGQQIADNFQLIGDETIGGIGWFGGYFQVADDETLPRFFKLRIFNDIGGRPSTNPFFEEVVSVAGVDTGTDSSFDNSDIFQYTAVITPVGLTAGIQYWLSVLENDISTNSNSQWFWQASSGICPPNIDECAASRVTETDPWVLGLGGPTGSRDNLAFSLSAADPVTEAPNPRTLHPAPTRLWPSRTSSVEAQESCLTSQISL